MAWGDTKMPFTLTLEHIIQVVSIFLVLAGYLTSQSWGEWRGEPVVTTLKHTAQPVTKVLKFSPSTTLTSPLCCFSHLVE